MESSCALQQQTNLQSGIDLCHGYAYVPNPVATGLVHCVVPIPTSGLAALVGVSPPLPASVAQFEAYFVHYSREGVPPRQYRRTTHLP